MFWKKNKLVFCPKSEKPWMASHAANPFPYILDKDKAIVRVFFTSRNICNESSIGYVDVDFNNNFNIINISEKPVVSPGALGSFDDSGAAMGYLIEKDNHFFLYYLGWNLKVKVPWLNTIGLAVSDSIGGIFSKQSSAPIMDRNSIDPFSISYPSILFDNGVYKMWYGSNLSWGKDQSEMAHVIKYAESTNLIDWKREGEIHVELKNNHEYAISKPWVIYKNNLYQMWYSFRASLESSNYRIGYAESIDGRSWIRKDDIVGIDVSRDGWDSEMICYPAIFTIDTKTFMLYNGNGYGKTGFGIATLIE
jgi:predicted GH43/DUF377 family glycosyl hydrolase